MTVCAICNRELRQVTWGHLSHHKLTITDYKLLFPDRMNDVLNSSNWKKGHVPWTKGRDCHDITLKSLETRRNRGNISAWNKGLTKETDSRVAYNTRNLKGRISWNKGLTKETDSRLVKTGDAISIALKGRYVSEEWKMRISISKQGQIAWNRGLTKETDIRIAQYSKKARETNLIQGTFKGERNPNWRGGTSFEPYGIDFNSELKDLIKERDNYTCQICSVPEYECIHPLIPHHIDYNKDNNSEDNLISLCRRCHSRTNFNRKKWIIYFGQKHKLQIPLRFN